MGVISNTPIRGMIRRSGIRIGSVISLSTVMIVLSGEMENHERMALNMIANVKTISSMLIKSNKNVIVLPSTK